jgi:hypothetical protein
VLLEEFLSGYTRLSGMFFYCTHPFLSQIRRGRQRSMRHKRRGIEGLYDTYYPRVPRLSLQSSEFAPPPGPSPSPASECSVRPWNHRVGGQHSLAGGGVGGPSSNDWRESLAKVNLNSNL